MYVLFFSIELVGEIAPNSEFYMYGLFFKYRISWSNCPLIFCKSSPQRGERGERGRRKKRRKKGKSLDFFF